MMPVTCGCASNVYLQNVASLRRPKQNKTKQNNKRIFSCSQEIVPSGSVTGSTALMPKLEVQNDNVKQANPHCTQLTQ
jgi:hypothetical protein